MYDIVRVFFSDGSSTVFHVSEGDDIRDKIVDLCEDNGWDMLTAVDYNIEGQVEEDE